MKKLSIIITTISITFLQSDQSVPYSNSMNHENVEKFIKHFAEAYLVQFMIIFFKIHVCRLQVQKYFSRIIFQGLSRFLTTDYNDLEF